MLCRIKFAGVAKMLTGCAMISFVVVTMGCGGANENESANVDKIEVVDDNNDPIDDPDAKNNNLSNNDPNSNGNAGPVKPPVFSADTLGSKEISYEVPNGSADEVMEFVRNIRGIPPQSPEQANKLLDAALAGIDKVLEMDVAIELRREVVGEKMKILSTMNEMRARLSPEQRNILAAEKGAIDPLAELGKLAKDLVDKETDASLVRMGRIQLLSFKMDEFISGRAEDFEVVRASVQTLINDEKNLKLLAPIGKHIIGQLYQSGNETEAVELMKTFGTAMKGNEELAQIGEAMLQEAALIESVNATRDNKPGAEEKLLAHVQKNFASEDWQRVQFFESLRLASSISVKASRSATQKVYGYLFGIFSQHQKKMFGPSGPDSQTLNIMMVLATESERVGNVDDARKLYDRIDQFFREHSDPTAVSLAMEGATAGRKRLDLIGKPLEVTGETLEGKVLDWKEYQGKVVLVDFWATDCRPCMTEIPNLERYLKAYHDKGFEVVGVNMDFQRERVDHFRSIYKMQWPSVVSNTPDTLHPLVDQCGIQSPPFVVLINQKGVVEELHVRGDRLGEKLAELLGEPNPTNDVGQTESPLGGHFVFFGADEEEAEEKEENPYLADADLDVDDLIDFILDMELKPRSIQRRPGFTEAIAEAADRVLATDSPKAAYVRIATISKIDALHKSASFGDEKADKQLEAFTEKIKDSMDKRIAKEVKFLQLERRAINSDDLKLDEVEKLLAELQAFFETETVSQKHLRMASSTVHAINRLDSEDPKEKEKYGDMREAYFKQFGEVFAKSDNKDLARYGKKLAKSKAAASDLVGKPLEIEGTTALGQAFNWKAYRGKVVVVDFWATWCGPCIREMPNVKAFYEKHNVNGFEVVGVSLDKDLDALGAFIEENKIAWENLSGDGTQQLAEKYGVRGIPTMMLVDREGKVVAVSHKIGDLTKKAEELLAKKAS